MVRDMKIKLTRATVKHASKVYAAFASRKDFFPHIRKDYVQRMCAKGSVVFCQSVYIIFDQYKRKVRLGDTFAPRGSYILHQIVNTEEGNGCAAVVFDAWVNSLPGDCDLFLTVRADNKRARWFYKCKGFTKVGNISWSGGKLPGIVYRKPL